MPATVEKVCVVCRKDVAGQKRIKDPAGRYYCEPCAAATRARAAAKVAPTPAPLAPEPLIGPDDGIIDFAPRPEPVTPPAPSRERLLKKQLPPGLPCPCCEKVLPSGAKICIDCGIKVPSGKPMITALGRDEDMLYANTETIIRALSWLMWLGLYPIASEAYAIKKPIVTWAVAIITTVCSIAFFVAIRSDSEHDQAMHLMLWPPHHAMTDRAILDFSNRHQGDEIGEMLRDAGKDVDLPADATPDQRTIAAIRSLGLDKQGEDFHPYQLVTNIFLHDPSSLFRLIMHLGGNMLFLLIFGTRVNALIGNMKMLILYPLLGMAASAAHIAFSGSTHTPALGASGAIMGLAGMYLIFFPVHRVYMAFWLKIFWRIPTWIKIWPMRGFWVLAIYLGFDIASTLMRSKDGVAHWAHLGGFAAGALIALAMLIARLQHANNGDLLSVLLGRHSWPLIGKPKGTLQKGVTRLPGGLGQV